jgi:tetratricopeptide (TPR) repeat protein
MRMKDLEPFEAEWLAEAPSQVEALRNQRGTCPSFRLIRASRAEALPAELQAAVASHVAVCRICASLQEDLGNAVAPADITREETRRILSLVRAGDLSGEKNAPWRFLSWRAAFATAALALCAIIVIQQVRKTAQPTSPTETASGQEPAMQVPEALKLDKPEVKLTVAILTWRTRGSNGQQFLTDIAPALNLYRENRFEDAARQLDALSAKYPASVEIFFYLGVSRLFLEDHAVAIQALEKADALAGDSFSDDVSWYLALAWFNSGRIADAQSRLTSLAGGSGPHAARARAAVEALRTPASSR